MRVLVDPATGEMVEVLAEHAVGEEGYDLQTFRRSALTQSVATAELINAYEDRSREAAQADREYHRLLSVALLRAKKDHGATVAETVAKGSQDVLEARENKIASEGLQRAAWARIQAASEDRVSTHRQAEWGRDRERMTGGA